MKVFKILLLLIAGFIPLHSFAQEPIAQDPKKILMEKEIGKIIAKNNARHVIKDSIALYIYNIKLKVSKKGEKIKINRLLMSDPLLYKIIPDHKRLYNIDYKFLLTDRNQVTLIIPIIIANVAERSVSEYDRQKGVPLIPIKSTFRQIDKALTRIASDDKQWDENVVITMPYTIKIE
ncbi:hypothetical protein [Pedobacter gandavensis]|uniref:DUF4230 domain-containing protein n=1 Tax=Pedobacter gandavensis TaxID=2679963 RepID=A0ABR6F4J1_9SPHI|nr:hypothetical protein [Pedobacter gandavensis]MBB2151618.1 hypothetical protein [Pedobacter gandavensis]